MIELRTLGSLDLRDSSGQELRPILSQPKRLALLVYLTLTQPQGFRRRDSVVGLFWPDLDQDHARGALRQALRFLRRSLGEGVVVTRGEEEISIDGSLIRCDAVAFRKACETEEPGSAMELYRGGFLDGFFVSDAAPEFEGWVEDERTRLRRQAARAAWTLSVSSRAAGDSRAAVSWARRAISYAPNDEGEVRRVIELLDALGDCAGAMEIYQEFASRLALEFEAEPSIETRQLIETVRARSGPDRTSLHARQSGAPADEAERGESPDVVAAASQDDWAIRRPGRTLVLLTTVGLVAIGGYLAAFSRPDPPVPELNADLVAIAPFDVFDSTLAFWREGMVDLLSRDLDGAGPLRTVPQTVALRRWQGRGDRGSAEAFGRSTGAGVVAFGSLLRRGRDSVTLRATLMNVARGSVEPDLEVSGETDRLGELADSLGIEILRTLGRTRPIGSVRQVTIGSRSLPALKAFLLGEQFYRKGLWDSALVAYDRALALDSGFTLAHRRMGMVLGWFSPTWRAFEPADSYTQHAARLNHGLPVRDSLLVAAAALDLTADEATNGDSLLARRKKAWATLERAAQRFPGDPEVWFTLGESRSHYQSPWNPAPTLEAFERALVLDPRFGPAYEHTIQLGIQVGDPDRARRYAAAYLELNPTGAGTEEVRLTQRMLDPLSSRSAETERVMATASAGALFRTAQEHLGSWPDSAETSIRLLRELATGRHDTAGTAPWVADPQMWPKYLATALMFRGHLKAASQVYEALITKPDTNPWSNFSDPFLDLALFDALPSGYDAQVFGTALLLDSAWSDDPNFEEVRFLGLPWYLAKRDTNSLARYAQRAEAAGRHPDSPIVELRSRYLGGAAKAYLTLARGDSAGALRAFQRLSEDLCVVNACSFQKLTEARLLRARGENRAAGEVMDRWLWSLNLSPFFVLGTLERGHIGEELGDRETAARAYRFVADVWRRADHELQPYVTEARAGILRMSGVRSR